MNSHGRKTKGNGIFDYRPSKIDRIMDKAMTIFEWGLMIFLVLWAAYGVWSWLWGG